MRWFLGASICVLSLGACNKSSPAPDDKGATPPAATGEAIELHGAGATFPYPLYSKLFSEYGKLHPDVRVSYQSIGSGGGIQQILARTVDFGASDAPMTDAELARAPGKLLHIPMTLGAVVVTYNLPGVARLELSPEVVTALFLGEIKTWDDARISALNPGVKLPALAVNAAYRSDGSGTTAVFTEYLAKVSPTWKSKVGAGKSVKFPVGMGAKGNEGVTGVVKTTPGTVAYVELAYAKQNQLPYAAVKNASGKLVEPTPEGITAAAAGAVIPEDFRVSITNAPGEGAYPISAFTYVLVSAEQADAKKGKALADLLLWSLGDGQQLGAPLHYAALPAAVAEKAAASVRAMTAGGKPLL